MNREHETMDDERTTNGERTMNGDETANEGGLIDGGGMIAQTNGIGTWTLKDGRGRHGGAMAATQTGRTITQKVAVMRESRRAGTATRSTRGGETVGYPAARSWRRDGRGAPLHGTCAVEQEAAAARRPLRRRRRSCIIPRARQLTRRRRRRRRSSFVSPPPLFSGGVIAC